MEKDLTPEDFQTNLKKESIYEIKCSCRENEEDLSNFEGTIEILRKKEDEPQIVRMDINNFIPRSAMIRNTTKIFGLVVYIGKNTKIMKNLQQRIYK